MNKYRETLVDGCKWYDDTFNEDFVDDDRTWKVARMMAYISAISSTVAMVRVASLSAFCSQMTIPTVS
jgi:hypothetical protein